MKTKLVLIALTIFCFANLYSQKNGFEKGYFIDNNNSKVEGFIKNEEWSYNPTEILFKADENSKSQLISITDFKEFVVGEEYKFKKASVKIDKSHDSFEQATGVKSLSFVDDFLLLRIRIEGKATLYSYRSETYTRFFFSLNQSEITPLSYKVYYDDQEKGYRKNETYKQELLNNLKCDDITQNDVDRLEYNISKLSDFFSKYNLCSGSTNNEIKIKKNVNTFEIYVKAGVGITSFSYDDGSNIEFDDKAKFKLAVEAEINLSNKAKNWSFLIEPAYQSYTNTGQYQTSGTKISVDYKSIDFSLGLRKYFSLSTKSSLFLNGYMTYGISTKSEISSSFLNISKTINPSLGFGYSYNQKYNIELRYEFSRNLFRRYATIDSNFSTVGVVIGYKFL